MYLRPYRKENDFAYLQKWVKDKRTHVLWCANRIPYPLRFDSFHAVLEKSKREWGDSAYIFADSVDQPVGFFCYSVRKEEKEGFLKFVIVDDKLRGNGYGVQMLEALLRQTYLMDGVNTVRLNVFDINEKAKKCYRKAGFTEVDTAPGSFRFEEESWGRCSMAATRKSGTSALSEL